MGLNGENCENLTEVPAYVTVALADCKTIKTDPADLIGCRAYRMGFQYRVKAVTMSRVRSCGWSVLVVHVGYLSTGREQWYGADEFRYEV